MASPCDTLDRFLDGALSRASGRAFRLHLPACPGCQRRISSALQLGGMAAQARRSRGVGLAAAPDGGARQVRKIGERP
jgi:anti-sigma factor RsiW